MEENEVRQPKNSLGVLRWLAVPGYLLAYLSLPALIAGLDLPTHFPEQFQSNVVKAWSENFGENLLFLLYNTKRFLIVLVFYVIIIWRNIEDWVDYISAIIGAIISIWIFIAGGVVAGITAEILIGVVVIFSSLLSTSQFISEDELEFRNTELGNFIKIIENIHTEKAFNKSIPLLLAQYLFLVYLSSLAIIAGFDLPVLFAEGFQNKIINTWGNNFGDNLLFLLGETVWYLITAFALGLFLSLKTRKLDLVIFIFILGHLLSLVFGLAVGPARISAISFTAVVFPAFAYASGFSLHIINILKDKNLKWKEEIRVVGEDLSLSKYSMIIFPVFLFYGVAYGTSFGLVGSLALGSWIGFLYGIVAGLVGAGTGFIVGACPGILMLLVKLMQPVPLGFKEGLTVGVVIGLTAGLLPGLVIFFVWIALYYRLHFLLYDVFGIFNKATLADNPYLRHSVLFFPLPTVLNRLQEETFDSPNDGAEFIKFCIKKNNNPLQFFVLFRISIAHMAGTLHDHRCISTALINDDILLIDNFKDFITDFDGLDSNNENNSLGAFQDMLTYISFTLFSFWFLGLNGIIKKLVNKRSHYKSWENQRSEVRKALLDVECENNAQLRVHYFKAFREELDKLYRLTHRQRRSWGHYFAKALKAWQKTADTKLRDLELEAAAQEPIVPNIYRPGEKLRPIDKELFLGRDELRDNFKKRVVTATSMPLFFIQGQRRVGKSSLIAFLPTILDRGFRVAAYDMQEHPGIPLPALLLKIQERIHETLSKPKDRGQQPPPKDANWLDAWNLFQKDLEGVARKEEAKIVLVIDEYEELHKILKTNPEAGAHLLAAMRSWSQSQNKVVFLFAGAEFFTDLREPNWGEFFVQAERLYVDYLGREDAFKLIQLAGLHYPPDLLERMFQDTQGHPCWLQIICRDIVTMVNKTGRTSREVTEADYEAALNRILTDRDDQVMRNFWHQFCQNWGLKDTVRQVLRGETPADERALLMLEDHHFIVPEGAGWRMRAPIFEGWLRRYQAT